MTETEACLLEGGKSHREELLIQAGQAAASSSVDLVASMLVMVAMMAMLSRLYCAFLPYTCTPMVLSAHVQL